MLAASETKASRRNMMVTCYASSPRFGIGWLNSTTWAEAYELRMYEPRTPNDDGSKRWLKTTPAVSLHFGSNPPSFSPACCAHVADNSVGRCELLASAAVGGFEAVDLRFALGAETASGGFSVWFFARAVVESGVRIDPDFDGGVSLMMDCGCGGLGDS